MSSNVQFKEATVPSAVSASPVASRRNSVSSTASSGPADAMQSAPQPAPVLLPRANPSLQKPVFQPLSRVGLPPVAWPTWVSLGANRADDAAKAAIPGLISSADRETEHLHGGTYTVWNLSKYVKETPAVNMPNLKVVLASDFLDRGTVFFGFGLPNVFLGEVPKTGELGDAVKVDAKSFHRAPTKVVHTHGRLQSGVFLVPTNLPEEALQRTRDVALKREGRSNITCVRANSIILEKAGFTIGGKSPRTTLPSRLLENILTRGIEFDGKPVEFAILRTSPLKLNEFVDAIDAAVNHTACRHKDNAYDTAEARAARIAEINALREAPDADEDMLSTHAAPRSGPFYNFSISQSSDLGAWARALWGPHPIYKLDFGSQGINVDDYLPTKLQAFPHKNPSLATRLKKNILFSRPVVGFVRGQMANAFKAQAPLVQGDINTLLRLHTKEDPNIFNVVVTSRELMTVKNDVSFGKVDWVLSKHVLISGYSDDVRFAGEMWRDEDGVHFNPNSGTYMPSEEQAQQMGLLCKRLFPNVNVKVDKVAIG